MKKAYDVKNLNINRKKNGNILCDFLFLFINSEMYCDKGIHFINATIISIHSCRKCPLNDRGKLFDLKEKLFCIIIIVIIIIILFI